MKTARIDPIIGKPKIIQKALASLQTLLFNEIDEESLSLSLPDLP